MLKPILFLLAISMSVAAKSETFRIAYYDGGDAPFVYTTAGKVTGIFPEVMSAIAHQSGDQLEVQVLPIKRVFQAFEMGITDIEVGVNPKWRSTSSVPGLYSDPFVTVNDILCYRPGERRKHESVTSFKGETIGVIANYSHPEFDASFANGSIKRADIYTNPSLLIMLKANRFNQIIISQYVKQYWTKVDAGKYNCEEGRYVQSSDIMLRVHPSKAHALPRLNAAIEALKKNGELNAILKRNVN